MLIHNKSIIQIALFYLYKVYDLVVIISFVLSGTSLSLSSMGRKIVLITKKKIAQML